MAARPLGAWELYRALNDALDEGHDQFDLSNRDARLAMMLMGGLNAALVILASQTSLGADLSTLERQIEGGVIAVYALFAIAFLLQAIDALRPKQYRPRIGRMAHRSRRTIPAASAITRTSCCAITDAHWQAWRNVSVEQLNAELAVQLHSLCLKNHARKIALRGLYRSLRNMTVGLLGDPVAVRDLQRVLGERVAHARRHLFSNQLDARQHLLVRQRAAAVFQIEARQAEHARGVDDLRRDRLGRADAERAARARLALEMRARRRRPAALAADAVHHRLIVRPQLFLRGFVGRGDVAGRMHRDRLRRLAEFFQRLACRDRRRAGSGSDRRR